MKLKMQASEMGSSTSRAKYNVATMITAISMALSVEDDGLTADPPTNDALDCRAQSLRRRPTPSSHVSSGMFAESSTFSRERRKRLDLVSRIQRMPVAQLTR
jgi:hypothetical protein